MLENLKYVATTKVDAAEAGLFSALGIDWKMFVLQSIAFLILLWVLSRYVYPILVKAIDEREDKIAESQRAATEATAQAEQAKEEIGDLLKEARLEASEIVASAKEQADKLAKDSDERAKTQADHIVNSAHEQITKDIAAAKKTLHNETLELVAYATEKVVGKTVNKDIDKKIISTAVEEAK